LRRRQRLLEHRRPRTGDRQAEGGQELLRLQVREQRPAGARGGGADAPLQPQYRWAAARTRRRHLEQPCLVATIRSEKRKSLDGVPGV
jgi:hypothetical protein